MAASLGPLVGAIDQGTSSTRFLVFNAETAELLSHHQVEIKQEFPREGWVEQDPKEILNSVYECVEKTCEKMKQLNINIANIRAIGVTNQRETTVVWDKTTGEPLYNAIVWLDLRTQSTVERLLKKVPGRNKTFSKFKTGLPLSTYFSAVKLRWLLDNVEEIRKAVEDQRAMFGTIDSWLIWSLTGGKNGGIHCTDVTNASRTMLFNIHSLEWDPELCKFFDIPMEILPTVRSSSEIYGVMESGALTGVPISGSVFSEHGLITTIAYKMGRDKPTFYALEGSVAIAGAVVRWLRDNLGIAKTSQEVEKLAADVGTSYGCYFVPAFSGLYAPYWEPSARGIICGLTQFTNKNHIAFAALEAVCFQTRELSELSSRKLSLFLLGYFSAGLMTSAASQRHSANILDAMNKDCGIPLSQLQVDGGMTNNKILMQLQSDILCIPVVKPSMPETTALGAAMAAGAAEGVEVWSLNPGDLTAVTCERFEPQINPEESEYRYARWKKAVMKSMGWETSEGPSNDLWAAGLEVPSLAVLQMTFVSTMLECSLCILLWRALVLPLPCPKATAGAEGGLCAAHPRESFPPLIPNLFIFLSVIHCQEEGQIEMGFMWPSLSLHYFFVLVFADKEILMVSVIQLWFCGGRGMGVDVFHCHQLLCYCQPLIGEESHEVSPQPPGWCIYQMSEGLLLFGEQLCLLAHLNHTTGELLGLSMSVHSPAVVWRWDSFQLFIFLLLTRFCTIHVFFQSTDTGLELLSFFQNVLFLQSRQDDITYTFLMEQLINKFIHVHQLKFPISVLRFYFLTVTVQWFQALVAVDGSGCQPHVQCSKHSDILEVLIPYELHNCILLGLDLQHLQHQAQEDAPPKCFSSMALSTTSSAVRPKHCSLSSWTRGCFSAPLLCVGAVGASRGDCYHLRLSWLSDGFCGCGACCFVSFSLWLGWFEAWGLAVPWAAAENDSIIEESIRKNALGAEAMAWLHPTIFSEKEVGVCFQNKKSALNNLYALSFSPGGTGGLSSLMNENNEYADPVQQPLKSFQETCCEDQKKEKKQNPQTPAPIGSSFLQWGSSSTLLLAKDIVGMHGLPCCPLEATVEHHSNCKTLYIGKGETKEKITLERPVHHTNGMSKILEKGFEINLSEILNYCSNIFDASRVCELENKQSGYPSLSVLRNSFENCWETFTHSAFIAAINLLSFLKLRISIWEFHTLTHENICISLPGAEMIETHPEYLNSVAIFSVTPCYCCAAMGVILTAIQHRGSTQTHPRLLHLQKCCWREGDAHQTTGQIRSQRATGFRHGSLLPKLSNSEELINQFYAIQADSPPCDFRETIKNGDDVVRLNPAGAQLRSCVENTALESACTQICALAPLHPLPEQCLSKRLKQQRDFCDADTWDPAHHPGYSPEVLQQLIIAMLLLICFLVLRFVKLSTDMHKINICLLISADIAYSLEAQGAFVFQLAVASCWLESLCSTQCSPFLNFRCIVAFHTVHSDLVLGDLERCSYHNSMGPLQSLHLLAESVESAEKEYNLKIKCQAYFKTRQFFLMPLKQGCMYVKQHLSLFSLIKSKCSRSLMTTSVQIVLKSSETNQGKKEKEPLCLDANRFQPRSCTVTSAVLDLNKFLVSQAVWALDCVPLTGQMAAQSTPLSAHTRLSAHAFNSSILNNIYYLRKKKRCLHETKCIQFCSPQKTHAYNLLKFRTLRKLDTQPFHKLQKLAYDKSILKFMTPSHKLMLGSQRTKENNFDQLEDNIQFPKEEYFSVFHHDAKLARDTNLVEGTKAKRGSKILTKQQNQAEKAFYNTTICRILGLQK
ncbi:hypothetical protein IHE44_0005019 [Lamprotornis superbus]|uniref:glycerol kinase n=1 Tax=Lamprotornis superbus TaxID=245042 RepID=A0A835NY25_9PASS|nr:hypothetical protein IHE44_0005019 [Lamprotornis superbus]